MEIDSEIVYKLITKTEYYRSKMKNEAGHISNLHHFQENKTYLSYTG